MGVAAKLNGVRCYQHATRSGVSKAVISTGTGGVENSPTPIFYFTFESNSGAGTNVTDDSVGSTAHDATLVGSTWNSGDPIVGTYSLTTLNGNRTTIANHADLNLEYDSPWSYSCWVNHSGIDWAGLYSRRDGVGGDYRGIAIFLLGRRLQVLIISVYGTTGPGGTDRAIWMEGDLQVGSGTDSHVVVTYDGSTNGSGVSAWIDGVADTFEVAGLHDTLGNDTLSNTNNASVGNDSNTTAYEVEVLDEVALIPAQLSSTQAAVLYNGGTAINIARGL